MSAYLVAGSQASKKNENKIYVMKWAEMFKTVDEDKECSDSDEENQKYREPIIRFESVSHRGSVNRIRAMHGSSIVATWNEDAELGIYNVGQAVEALDRPVEKKKKDAKKSFGGCKLAGFKHK